MASTMGRFKAYPRVVNRKRRSDGKIGKWTSPMKIIGNALHKSGYLVTKLKRPNGDQIEYKSHRLVGITFIPNPLNLPEVNHKKGIKIDNRVSELEWSTKADNIQHAFNNGLMTWGKYNSFGATNPKSKKIDQFTMDGVFIKTWDSQRQITSELGINQSQVWHVCNGKHKYAKGFIFKYSKGYGLGAKGANNTNKHFKL